MTDSTDPVSGVIGALTRLDQDIAEAELRLAKLRAMRESIQPFLEQYLMAEVGPDAEMPASLPGHGSLSAQATSFTDAVVKVFQDQPGAVLDVDDVLNVLQDNGIQTNRVSVRNAIYYAAKLGKLHKERRGRFVLQDTSTPDAAGVDVGEEPNV